jgi:putative peptide zinc metalloprotease protein
MALVCLVSWVTVPTGKFIHYLASSPRLDRVRVRAIGATVGLVGVLVVLLAVIPFPSHFRAPGVLQAQKRAQLVNDVAGSVTRLLSVPGSRVAQGQPLLELKSFELETELASTQARMQEIQARLLQALSETNADLKPLNSSLETISNQFSKLGRDRASLIVRASLAGIWVAPGVQEFSGRRLERGTAVGLLVDPSAFEFVATVRMVPGGKQTLPSAALGWAGGGEVPVTADEPTKAAEPFFEVCALVPNSRATQMFHGRSGKIRFDLKPEPLLPRWGRRLFQLLQKRYQL